MKWKRCCGHEVGGICTSVLPSSPLPAAHSSNPRTSSQSPLSCSSVRDAARSRHVSMRVRAVPGYFERTSSVSPAAPIAADAGEEFIFPTGSQDEGSGPEPSLAPLNGEDDAAEERGAKVQKNDAAVMRRTRREELPLLLRGSLRDDGLEECGDWEFLLLLLAAEVEGEQNALVVTARRVLRGEEKNVEEAESKLQARTARVTLCISGERSRALRAIRLCRGFPMQNRCLLLRMLLYSSQ